MGIDLRKEFQVILDSDGLDYLFLIQSRTIRCSKWSGKEHNPRCLECGGTGWAIRFGKYKAIKQNASTLINHAVLTQNISMGSVWSPGYIFFAPPHIPLQIKDRIFEVGWRNGIPWGMNQYFTVNHLDVMRGVDGKPAFLYIGAMTESVDAPFQNTLVNALSKQMLAGDQLLRKGK